MKNKILLAALIILISSLGAYLLYSKNEAPESADYYKAAVTSGDNAEPGSSVHDLPIEPAAVVARKDLAQKLGVDEKDILILEVKDETWNDGCLGLAQADEMCTMALVPGFWVLMTTNGKEFSYRTNKDGSVIRQEKS